MSDSTLFHHWFPTGPLQCNCSIIGDRQSGRALVVDPGGDAEKILGILADNKLRLSGIIHTHAHLDHILASGHLRRVTQAPLKVHEQDMFLWDSAGEQCRWFGLEPIEMPPPDAYLRDDEDLGCCDGVALHTPGHTPGSMSFWFGAHKLLLAGDTLFNGSIGRTDMPGGDARLIARSIRERLYSLDEDAEVIAGHGPATTIGGEMRANPFVRA